MFHSQCVGIKMPRYRLFGETAKFAALLNSTGEGQRHINKKQNIWNIKYQISWSTAHKNKNKYQIPHQLQLHIFFSLKNNQIRFAKKQISKDVIAGFLLLKV